MNFSKKIKLFYFPFLVTAIAICILYTFLNWLLIIHLEVLSIKEFVVNFGIPLALPWIPILLYLMPRFKLLNLTTKKGKSWSDFYMIILWLVLAVPTMIAQNYIEAASGKLTELDNISQIDSLPKTQYYTAKKMYVDKQHIGVYNSFDVSGKHDNDFNMHLFVAVPVYSSSADTSHVVSWIGIPYSKTISNNLEENEKEEAYKLFTDECQTAFDSVNLMDFTYLKRVPNSDDGDGLKEAVKQHTKYTNKEHEHIFLVEHEPFTDRVGSQLKWVFITFAIGAGIWLIMILIPSFNYEVLQAYEAGVLDTNEDIKEFIDYLKPKKGFVITPILMYVNVGIFLAMFFLGLGFLSFKSEDLIIWGANYGPLTSKGEWWRLLSSTFLHGGLMHVLANMYGLLFVGIFLEPVLGKLKYLGIYLITGIVASAASLWWNDQVVSVGASGAIFGLYGVFLALLVTKIFPKEMGMAFMVSTLIFVGYNLLMGVLGNGIDNAAHIGGLVSGFIIGLALYPSLKGTIIEENPDEQEEKDTE